MIIDGSQSTNVIQSTNESYSLENLDIEGLLEKRAIKEKARQESKKGEIEDFEKNHVVVAKHIAKCIEEEIFATLKNGIPDVYGDLTFNYEIYLCSDYYTYPLSKEIYDFIKKDPVIAELSPFPHWLKGLSYFRQNELQQGPIQPTLEKIQKEVTENLDKAFSTIKSKTAGVYLKTYGGATAPFKIGFEYGIDMTERQKILEEKAKDLERVEKAKKAITHTSEKPIPKVITPTSKGNVQEVEEGIISWLLGGTQSKSKKD